MFAGTSSHASHSFNGDLGNWYLL